MSVSIESYKSEQLSDVVDLSLRAWAPVFESIEAAMNPELYEYFYRDGWRAPQEQDVTRVCTSEDTHTWVALADGAVAGFVAVNVHDGNEMGEIYMIAVDPNFQKCGIAMALTEFTIAWMKEQGIPLAMVETGSDPGHAPARRTYEKAGFTVWPASRYFKKI